MKKTTSSNRSYRYIVSITFNGVGISKAFQKSSVYKGSQSYTDSFEFDKNSCVIKALRSKKYDDGKICSTAKNTINTQIIKALLCYYAVATDYPTIKKISIIREQKKDGDYKYEETNSIIQPIECNANRTKKCDFKVIDCILEDTPRGQAIRIAMSYWLKGISSDDTYYKFEHLWRAFNSIYTYHGNHRKENDNLIEMRKFILNNQDIFQRSIKIVAQYDLTQLSAFRWSRMILNDYDSESKTTALSEFIKRYSDYRIMQMLKEKIKCREQYLKNAHLYDEVINHINLNTSIVDAELVTLLTIKYAYFVRNKLFHGEVLDGTFKIKENNRDSEIKTINGVLETVIWDIIEYYDRLRDPSTI